MAATRFHRASARQNASCTMSCAVAMSRVDPSFDEFVKGSSTGLIRLAYLLTGDRGHAEDLLQTALLRTARHWSRARDAPDAYVRQVLVNLSRDRIRLLFRRPRETPFPHDPETLRITDGGYDHAGRLPGWSRQRPSRRRSARSR
ncbi:sigma factor [Dactylosporangium sp. CA-233914]|uniref:sigma factor n=1 Tax=Dactylosporangium sp. CA-233914 TaxID=3239934 RepID=UPI003D8B7505